MSRSLQALVDLLVGPPGHQRVRASQTLLAVMVCLTFAVVQHVEVMLGLIDLYSSNALTTVNVTGTLSFYFCIRTGLNLRMKGDPSLTMAQSAFAMVMIAWSYSITGPARGSVIPIMLLVIFFGMFALTPRQAISLCALGLGLLSSAMAWKAWTDPLRYDPHVEIIQFLFATIVISAVSALSIRLGKMRSRLSKQKKELQAALEHIQTLATRDALTQLLNRRAMMDALRQEAQRVPRGSGPMCVALLDLDLFKSINDTHGHAAGDRVLKGVADAALEALRSTDVLSRWGGEEFLLMLPNTGVASTRACLERVRAQLAVTHFDDIAPGLRVTFSAGFAQCHGIDDLEQSIERADKAMYTAKFEGRNQTAYLDHPAPPAVAAQTQTHATSPLTAADS